MRHDELLSDFQGKNEARAGGFQIECGSLLCANDLLYEAGGGRERHVRGNGGDDDQINLRRRDTGVNLPDVFNPRAIFRADSARFIG